MKRSVLQWGLGVLLTCLVEPAQAQSIEKDTWEMAGRHFVLSVERLAAVTAWRDVEEDWGGGSAEIETSGVEASLLTINTGDRRMTLPRLAFDYVTPKGLSVGGAFGYFRSGSTENLPYERQYEIAPRLGWWIPHGRVVLWLRGGITYSSWSSTHDNDERVPCDACGDYVDDPVPPKVKEARTSYRLSLDPQLLVCLVPHVAVSVGVSLEQGFTGTFSRDYFTEFSPYDVDLSSSTYALTTGVSAIF